MKVSEITTSTVASYLRLDEYEEAEIQALIDVSINYIVNYTGLTSEVVNDMEDMYIVVLVLCQDMYDNRTFYVEKSQDNKIVKSILDMHRVNLI